VGSVRKHGKYDKRSAIKYHTRSLRFVVLKAGGDDRMDRANLIGVFVVVVGEFLARKHHVSFGSYKEKSQKKEKKS
jgi:hypothetical protein